MTKRILFGTLGAFVVLALTGQALAAGCTVTAFATCAAVTADFEAPYGDAVHVDVFVDVDGIRRELVFDGEYGEVVVEDRGVLPVLLHWRGVLTIGERSIPFAGARTLERSGTDCGSPSPSPSPSAGSSGPPAPPGSGPGTAPALAFTGATFGLALMAALAVLGVGLLFVGRRRRRD